MWDFIKYCFKCLGIIISSGFGYNTDGLTCDTALVGIITLFVLGGLEILFCYLVYLLVNKLIV